MIGKKSGIAAKISEMEPKALVTYCHSHSLGNMYFSNVFSNKRTFSGRNSKWHRFWKWWWTYATLDILCSTRWAARATYYRKLIMSYHTLCKSWNLCLCENLSRYVKSHILGCQAQMEKFFGSNVGYRLHSITDIVSKALQQQKCQQSVASI